MVLMGNSHTSILNPTSNLNMSAHTTESTKDGRSSTCQLNRPGRRRLAQYKGALATVNLNNFVVWPTFAWQTRRVLRDCAPDLRSCSGCQARALQPADQ